MQRGRTWGDLDEVDTGVVDSDRHFLTGTTSQLKEIKTRPATFASGREPGTTAFSRSLQIGGDTRLGFPFGTGDAHGCLKPIV